VNDFAARELLNSLESSTADAHTEKDAFYALIRTDGWKIYTSILQEQRTNYLNLLTSEVELTADRIGGLRASIRVIDVTLHMPQERMDLADEIIAAAAAIAEAEGKAESVDETDAHFSPEELTTGPQFGPSP
jgi:hypothetical protein